jgi:heme-degrading monooxygenase HmoA
MIRVIHRLEAKGLCEEALARSWREAMSAICAKAKGALGGVLLRSEKHPATYVVVTIWESAQAWRDFWSKGPPEPQGDPAQNEVLTEIDVFNPTATRTAP